MAESALARKLLIQTGQSVLILNAPPGYVAGLQPLPESATVATIAQEGSGLRDVVQLFAGDRAQLERDAGAALGALKAGGVLWVESQKPISGDGQALSRAAALG